MATRAGMATLITEVRRLCNAGTADYTVSAETFWTDEQIQDVLDETREQWVMAMMTDDPVYDGTWKYYDYRIPGKNIEEASTSGAFVVRNASGSAMGTADYTVNYRARRVTFTADQAGASYTLDFRTYDLNLSAARVWEMKAAHLASIVDWESDNHKVKASQEADRALAMAQKFKSMAGPKMSQFRRMDEVWG